MTKEFTRQFRVRWSEVTAANRVPPSKYMEYLVETAFDWGAAYKLGFEESLTYGLVWVILETDIHFLQPLRYPDEFEFSIWMIDWRRIRGTRAFEVRLKDSQIVIVQGMQRVVSLDADTLRPKLVPDELVTRFRVEDPRSFPTQRFPKLGGRPADSFSLHRRVEWGELDRNVHLNNGEALRYADEVIIQYLSSLGWPPDRLFEAGLVPVPRRIHIKYQELGLWADRLKIETYPTHVQPHEVTNVIVVEREADSKGILQSIYHWGLVDLNTDEEQTLPPELYDSLSSLVEEARD
jgi:acyl-CoA thioester hydrolase